METSQVWAGTVFLGEAWMVYAGPLGQTTSHGHNAVQVISSPDGIVVVDRRGGRFEATSVAVPANVEHSLQAVGQHGSVAYLDPLTVRLDTDAIEVGVEVPVPPPDGFDDFGAAGTWAARVTEACGGRPKSALSDLVAEVMGLARHQLPATVSLGELAATLGFATSTVTHRFTLEAGIPFRRWVLWERLQLAAQSVSHGANLTTAAHAAGFADSAHLNRTFRRMFGITPSEVAGIVRWETGARPERSSN